MGPITVPDGIAGERPQTGSAAKARAELETFVGEIEFVARELDPERTK